MERSDIVERIKNILNKTEANGASPEEAASAIALAQKLMAKYGVFMSDIEAAEDKDEIVELRGKYGTKTVSQYQWFLAKELSSHFACDVIIRGSRHYGQSLVFIGEKTKVEAFKECFQFAFNTYQKAFKDYLANDIKEMDMLMSVFGVRPMSRDQKLQKRWDYFNGFIKGLTNELIKSENENALVIVKSEELNNYMDSLNIRHETINVRALQSAAAQEAGYRDGAYMMRNKNSVLV